MRDRTRSSIATTALSSVVGVQIVIFSFHNVIPSGANTYVSQYAGAGDRVMAGVFFRSAFYSSVVFGSIVGIVGRLSIVGISEICNSDDPRVTEAIREYLGIVFLTSPFFSVMLLVDGYFKSIRDASTPFILELLSLVLNSVLNYVMVVHFDYGIGGSAIAASMARLVPALCGLYMILRGENRGISVSLSLLQDLPPWRWPAEGGWAAAPGGRGLVEMAAQWAGAAADVAGCDGGKLDRAVMATYGTVDCIPRDQATCRDDDDDEETENDVGGSEVTRAVGPNRTLVSNLRQVLASSSRMAQIGVFDSIAACIYGACFTSLVRICGLLGEKEQAGLGAGLRGVEWLAFCLSEGFLAAAATSVGQCIGANAHERAMDVAILCCSMSAFSAGALGVPFVLFSEEISRALVSDDEGIVRYCAQYVHVMGWVMSLIGFEMACYGCLLEAGRASIACFVNGACNILRIPLAIYCLYRSQPAMEVARMSLWAFGLMGMENFPQPEGNFYCIGGVIAFTACMKAVIWFGYFSYLWMSGRYFRGASLVGEGQQCGVIVSKDYMWRK
jgi:Na+-driven multidrug efflux pump